MKIIALSDLHGRLIDIKENFDLMLICGDTLRYFNQEEFFFESFIKWVNNLNFNNNESKVVMIAGNHDWFFKLNFDESSKKRMSELTNGRLIYICDETYEFSNDGKSYKIYGTPYCKRFFDWAFMEDNDVLAEIYSKIPSDIDFLISHDAADINKLGYISEGRQKGKNAGNKLLSNAVLSAKPKYYFCGHIHSGNHNFSEYEGIKLANVSICNEEYSPINKPCVLDV